MIALRIEGRDRAVIGIPVSPANMNVAKRLEGRRKWIRGGGLSFEPTERNLGILRGAFAVSVSVAPAEPPPEAAQGRPGYVSRTEAYPLQVRAMEAIGDRPDFAVFSEQGTGKTKVAIDLIGKRWSEGAIDCAVVVAPPGVHRQWAEVQVPDHCGVPFRAAWWRTGKGWVDVTGGDAEAADRLPIVCVGYESLSGKAGEAVGKFLETAGRFMLVMDESHKVKNTRSRRWKRCAELARREGCVSRIAMTGTPIARNLVDEWAQLKIVDERILGIRYVTHFRNEYCVMGGWEGRQVIGSRNVDRFRERTAPYVFRATKGELGLAAKQHSRWVFDLAPRQRAIIGEIRSDLCARIDGGQVASVRNVVGGLVKMQQVSNGWVIPDPERDENGEAVGPPPAPVDLFADDPDANPRIAALRELLESEEDESPVIVWVRFRHDASIVAKAFPDSVECHGGVTAAFRADNLSRWMRGDVRFLVATPGTGGTGLNLQGACRRAIYHSNSENSIERWQSEDRIHRIGTTGVCTYHDLVARGSRDLAILANLRGKKSLSDLTLDDIRKELGNEA